MWSKAYHRLVQLLGAFFVLECAVIAGTAAVTPVGETPMELFGLIALALERNHLHFDKVAFGAYVAIVLGVTAIACWVRRIEARLNELERVAHPPVDLALLVKNEVTRQLDDELV